MSNSDSDNTLTNSTNSLNSIERKKNTTSYIVTTPLGAKRPRICSQSILKEIDIDATIDDITAIVEEAEKIVDHINNISITCCNSKCGDMFGRCFRVKAAVKTGDNKATII